MNQITFNVIPSKETNDHQVRVFIDGSDWLGDNQLGIDPPELFKQLIECDTGRLLIGRCGCGCIGCDDVFVNISRSTKLVKWEISKMLVFEFDCSDYDAKIVKLLDNTSWEDINRRLERLISTQFTGTKTNDGFSFNWVSTRIKMNIIHLSYSKGLEQRLLEFSWDGVTEESALKQGRIYKLEQFSD